MKQRLCLLLLLFVITRANSQSLYKVNEKLYFYSIVIDSNHNITSTVEMPTYFGRVATSKLDSFKAEWAITVDSHNKVIWQRSPDLPVVEKINTIVNGEMRRDWGSDLVHTESFSPFQIKIKKNSFHYIFKQKWWNFHVSLNPKDTMWGISPIPIHEFGNTTCAFEGFPCSSFTYSNDTNMFIEGKEIPAHKFISNSYTPYMLNSVNTTSQIYFEAATKLPLLLVSTTYFAKADWADLSKPPACETLFTKYITPFLPADIEELIKKKVSPCK